MEHNVVQPDHHHLSVMEHHSSQSLFVPLQGGGMMMIAQQKPIEMVEHHHHHHHHQQMNQLHYDPDPMNLSGVGVGGGRSPAIEPICLCRDGRDKPADQCQLVNLPEGPMCSVIAILVCLQSMMMTG